MDFEILKGTWDRPNLPIILNLFGGPGIGKTTAAAKIFVELKMLGIETANPEEHAKLAIWKGREDLLDQQLVILGQTWETLHALSDKVDVVVMDSPLMLCSVYAGEKENKHFHDTVADFHKKMPRINMVLQRPKGLVYSNKGRREDKNQAKIVDTKVQDALHKYDENYSLLEITNESAKNVAKTIQKWQNLKQS